MLCNRTVTKDIIVPKQLLILKSYTIKDELLSSMVDISNAIGSCDMEIKDDGIYYTPKVFENFNDSLGFGFILETFRRDTLKVCCEGNANNLHSISYFYLSSSFSKKPLEKFFTDYL